jgi:hypothetical protein
LFYIKKLCEIEQYKPLRKHHNHVVGDEEDVIRGLHRQVRITVSMLVSELIQHTATVKTSRRKGE